MKPYYEDGALAIYHGDCREILPALDVRPDLVLADPPYGLRNAAVNNRGKGRSTKGVPSGRFASLRGDNAPFDPSHLLHFRRLVLWGANHYADKLPPSPSWLLWDKRDGVVSNDFADGELAWTNLGGPLRIFRHRWMGMLRASERGERRVHPTQKPVALASWILGRASVAPDELVIVPYMGSGSDMLAAKRRGVRAIGIEIEERYCEIAARRLSQEVLPLGLHAVS